MGNKLGKELLEGKCFLMAKNVIIVKQIKKTHYQDENNLMKTMVRTTNQTEGRCLKNNPQIIPVHSQ